MQALTSRAGIAIIGKEHRVAFPQAAIDAIKQNTVDSLTRFHRDSPQALGIEIAVLRKQLAPALSAVDVHSAAARPCGRKENRDRRLVGTAAATYRN